MVGTWVRMRPQDPTEVFDDIGRRIAELRLSRGLTQEQLADDLRVSAKYVQRCEQGTNTTVRTLVRFANALGTRTAELFRVPKRRQIRKGRPRRGR